MIDTGTRTTPPTSSGYSCRSKTGSGRKEHGSSIRFNGSPLTGALDAPRRLTPILNAGHMGGRGQSGLLTMDGAWDLVVFSAALVAGLGYCFYWLRDTRRYRTAMAALS
jgi:hypothetical protein